MIKKTLKKIIEREIINLRKTFGNKEALRWTSKLFAYSLAASTLVVYGPKVMNDFENKIENSSYMKNIRAERQEKRQFEDNVLDAMKDRQNIIDYNSAGCSVDINGDKKPDAFVVNSTAVRYGCGHWFIIKIQN